MVLNRLLAGAGLVAKIKQSTVLVN